MNVCVIGFKIAWLKKQIGQAARNQRHSPEGPPEELEESPERLLEVRLYLIHVSIVEEVPEKTEHYRW